MQKMTDKEQFMSRKMHEIKEKGIRGKHVKHEQAVAVALSVARKKGFKV